MKLLGHVFHPGKPRLQNTLPGPPLHPALVTYTLRAPHGLLGSKAVARESARSAH